jgi:hypothetical protein
MNILTCPSSVQLRAVASTDGKDSLSGLSSPTAPGRSGVSDVSCTPALVLELRDEAGSANGDGLGLGGVAARSALTKRALRGVVGGLLRFKRARTRIFILGLNTCLRWLDAENGLAGYWRWLDLKGSIVVDGPRKLGVDPALTSARIILVLQDRTQMGCRGSVIDIPTSLYGVKFGLRRMWLKYVTSWWLPGWRVLRMRLIKGVNGSAAALRVDDGERSGKVTEKGPRLGVSTLLVSAVAPDIPFIMDGCRGNRGRGLVAGLAAVVERLVCSTSLFRF